MKYYNIADFVIELQNLSYDYVERRLKQYETDKTDADLTVSYAETEKIDAPSGERVAVTDNFREYYKTDDSYLIYDVLRKPDEYSAALEFNKDISRASARLTDINPLGGAPLYIRSYNMLGDLFKYFILLHDGFVMHSSSISYKGNGIAFSAPSGTGKSTHTGLWKKFYPDDTVIVNDDMPAIRFKNDVPYLCGTPWSGKTEINSPLSVPLKAIVMLKQAPENSIERMGSFEAVFNVLEEVLRPVYGELYDRVITYVDRLMKTVPVYLLKCNISQDAVETVKNTLNL